MTAPQCDAVYQYIYMVRRHASIISLHDWQEWISLGTLHCFALVLFVNTRLL